MEASLSHNGSTQSRLLLRVFFSTGEWAVYPLWGFNWFNSWRGESRRRRDDKEGDNYREETKTWEKCVSHWDFKIAPSNVDIFISGRVILDIGAFRGNCSFTGPWLHLQSVFIRVHPNSDLRHKKAPGVGFLAGNIYPAALWMDITIHI